jgi:UDP-glucose 4-epimerase
LVKSLIRDHAIDSVIHFAGSIVAPESIAVPLAYLRKQHLQDTYSS